MKRRWLAVLLVAVIPASAFQVDAPGEDPSAVLRRLESGRLRPGNDHPAWLAFAAGDYKAALAALDETIDRSHPWLRPYLMNIASITDDFVRFESERFELYLPADQAFLADYALPALEKAASYLNGAFDHAPQGRIRVEIYPTEELFSAASTLSRETLRRSGAIGICKFHRLMILTPRVLPLGYRWLDALAHEYAHLMINEVSAGKAELWLHEGTARYFDTAWRADPPVYLSPAQKTSLMEAFESGELIPFERMSPSLVYLDSQDEVSLAFAQVANAVDRLINEKGRKRFVSFLRRLEREPFTEAFRRVYGQDPVSFEKEWRASLPANGWEKTVGAMDDAIVFGAFEEDAAVGADAQGHVRLGDLMRRRGRLPAALIQYEKALDQEPDNAVILLKAARVQLELGNRRDAEKKLRRAVSANPNYGTPHIELARLAEPAEAQALLSTAISINPFDPAPHALLASALRRAGRDRAAAREDEIAESLK